MVAVTPIYFTHRNPRVPCHTMPQIDLSAWRENVVVGCQIGGRQIGVGQSAFPSPCTSCICTNEGVSFNSHYQLIYILLFELNTDGVFPQVVISNLYRSTERLWSYSRNAGNICTYSTLFVACLRRT